MKTILSWQYGELALELRHLSAHAGRTGAWCEPREEYCLRKHLLLIEAYASEAADEEGGGEAASWLTLMAGQARELRHLEERKLCGAGNVERMTNLVRWARKWSDKVAARLGGGRTAPRRKSTAGAESVVAGGTAAS